VVGLRPLQASDRPLAESLAELAKETRANALIEVDLNVSPDAAARLDRARREAVYYVAADALGNVARHAHARHATMTLGAQGDRVVLEVADDGIGFDTAKSDVGHGLHNMRERAFAVGGTLDLSASAGGGVRVRLALPSAREKE